MAAGDPQYEGSSKAIRTVRSTSAAVPVGPTDLYPAYVGQAAALWANDKSPSLDLVTMPGPTYPDAMYEGRSEAIHVFGDQPIIPPPPPSQPPCRHSCDVIDDFARARASDWGETPYGYASGVKFAWLTSGSAGSTFAVAGGHGHMHINDSGSNSRAILEAPAPYYQLYKAPDQAHSVKTSVKVTSAITPYTAASLIAGDGSCSINFSTGLVEVFRDTHSDTDGYASETIALVAGTEYVLELAVGNNTATLYISKRAYPRGSILTLTANTTLPRSTVSLNVEFRGEGMAPGATGDYDLDWGPLIVTPCERPIAVSSQPNVTWRGIRSKVLTDPEHSNAFVYAYPHERSNPDFSIATISPDKLQGRGFWTSGPALSPWCDSAAEDEQRSWLLFYVPVEATRLTLYLKVGARSGIGGGGINRPGPGDIGPVTATLQMGSVSVDPVLGPGNFDNVGAGIEVTAPIGYSDEPTPQVSAGPIDVPVLGPEYDAGYGHPVRVAALSMVNIGASAPGEYSTYADIPATTAAAVPRVPDNVHQVHGGLLGCVVTGDRSWSKSTIGVNFGGGPGVSSDFVDTSFFLVWGTGPKGYTCLPPEGTRVLCTPETSDTYGWQGLWQTDLLNGTTFENRNGGGALIPRTIAADLQAQWNDQTVPFQDGPIDREYRQYHTYQLSGLTPAIGVRLVCPSIVASRPAVMSGATITWKLYAYSDDNWYYAFPGWFPLNAVEIASGSLVTTDDPDIHPFETTFYLPGGPSRLLQLMLVCTATEGEGDSFFMGTQYAVRPRYTFEPYWTVAANVELYGIHLYPILCEEVVSPLVIFPTGPSSGEFTQFDITFRRQIGDPTTSLDRTVCLLESAAMVLDWQTKGAVKVWGGELVPWCGRSEAAIRAFGSNLQNAQQAWAHYGQYLDIRAGRTWDDLVARLNEGRAVILGGEYIELVTAGAACDSFTGGHAIALFPLYQGTRILVGDPLCGGFKYVEASILQAFATAQGVAFYGPSSPQPLYFGVSQPW